MAGTLIRAQQSPGQLFAAASRAAAARHFPPGEVDDAAQTIAMALIEAAARNVELAARLADSPCCYAYALTVAQRLAARYFEARARSRLAADGLAHAHPKSADAAAVVLNGDLIARIAKAADEAGGAGQFAAATLIRGWSAAAAGRAAGLTPRQAHRLLTSGLAELRRRLVSPKS